MRQEIIKNMIISGAIFLYKDHSDNNIHFSYKDIEVTTEFNINNNSFNMIDQMIDNNDIEKVKEDYFRELRIHLKINQFLEYDEDYDDEDIDQETSDDIDEDDEDYYVSYEDQLKKWFPGNYLTEAQKRGYASAEQKVSILRELMDIEKDTIYIFVSHFGLKITDNYIRFDAPSRSKSAYEWIFWAVTIIDKILNYFNEDEEED